MASLSSSTSAPVSQRARTFTRQHAATDPCARVVYIDNDPIVTRHNEALLANGQNGILAIEADIRRPHGILANEDFCDLIDFSRPVGVLFVAVLHFIPEKDDPQGSAAAFTRLMARGSYLAVSHITSDGTEPDVIATIHDAYRNASAPAIFRTSDQVRQFFNGLNLIDPGLVDVSD